MITGDDIVAAVRDIDSGGVGLMVLPGKPSHSFNEAVPQSNDARL
jgi:hypothetical protein